MSQKKTKSALTDAHIRDLERLQENCYSHLHRPMVVKVEGYSEEIFYICQQCLDAYMKEHPELKHLIIGFKR